MFENTMDDEQVEEGANLHTPVQEEVMEHPGKQVIVEPLFEIRGKDRVELIDERQHLLRSNCTFWRR